MAPWYVIQVAGGRERAVVQAVRQVVDSGLVEECFSPRWRTQRKVRGAWEDVERLLLPGYVVAATRDPARLSAQLARVPGFARLLRGEAGFTPLDPDEVAWIARHAQGSERVVPMSRAVKDGDEVVIVDGPLKDRWLRVVSVDRRRKTAYVEVPFLGRVKRVPVGLEIVAKPKEL